MDDYSNDLLRWIERDRTALIDFLCRFIRARTPNPPGHTAAACQVVAELLETHRIPYQIIEPETGKQNLIAAFDGARPGRRLILNGHMDVFPVADESAWTYPPWSGQVVNGRIYGRGACDMKCGTTASIFAFLYLYRIREHLSGRLTLTAVCDEENYGPAGAVYLMQHHPEILGDCCLNGEPSSQYTLRFGEKGILRLKVTVRTPGSHGAYTHLSPSATILAAQIIQDLRQLTRMPVQTPPAIARCLDAARAVTDQVLGAGGADTLRQVTLNVGQLHGGEVINLVPSACAIGLDIRLPVGVAEAAVLDAVKTILAKYPEAQLEPMASAPTLWSDPDGEMPRIIRRRVRQLKGFEPAPIVSLGGSDLRLWRARNIPAYYYGPTNHGMGVADEYVEIEEFLHIVRTHALAAHDYLTAGHSAAS